MLRCHNNAPRNHHQETEPLIILSCTSGVLQRSYTAAHGTQRTTQERPRSYCRTAEEPMKIHWGPTEVLPSNMCNSKNCQEPLKKASELLKNHEKITLQSHWGIIQHHVQPKEPLRKEQKNHQWTAKKPQRNHPTSTEDQWPHSLDLVKCTIFTKYSKDTQIWALCIFYM